MSWFCGDFGCGNVGCLWLHVSVVLTWCGAEVRLVDGAGIIVHWAYSHTPLVALDLWQPVRELHLLGVFYLHSVPWNSDMRRTGKRETKDLPICHLHNQENGTTWHFIFPELYKNSKNNNKSTIGKPFLPNFLMEPGSLTCPGKKLLFACLNCN